MGFVKIPVKGMCDITPSEMRLRQKLLTEIRQAYSKYGFEEIETPVMEHIENLTSKQGGENEKLIFKVMKRGAELERAKVSGKELADCGMRYDLTVPLARFYANNGAKLLSPFKAMQIGSVWRADNPQKGRFRQFVQCDIDILGDNTNFAEIELITATTDMLAQIFAQCDNPNITVHINDRRILTAAALKAGFTAGDVPSVLISLDKLDKIGYEGVESELVAKGYAQNVVKGYLNIYKNSAEGISCTDFCNGVGCVENEVVSGLAEIIDCCTVTTQDKAHIVFDPALVRGMGYYTGPIFEVSVEGFSSSVAGGGRYDEMIEKFSGVKTSAVGFSIGFERIVTILKDMGKGELKLTEEGVAYLIEKGVSAEKKIEIFRQAQLLRETGVVTTVQPMKKNLKFQIDELMKNGYTKITRVYAKEL